MHMNKCSCCGHVYEADVCQQGIVCPQCFWEEDNTVITQNDYSSANCATLNEYRKAYYKKNSYHG